jgi:sugar phosphate isomerase/epimerase
MNLIAGHTMGTPGMTVPDALRLFRDARLDAAEVVWQDAYECGIPENDGHRTLAAVETASRNFGVPVCALTPYMTGINSLDDRERERDLDRFRRCLHDASRLGASTIRVYAGSLTNPDDDRRDQKRSRLVESLRVLGPEAKSLGVTLAVENHFNTMTVSARETAGLMRDVEDVGGVGILYDQANLAFTHCEDYPEAISIQDRWIRHVHVKDLIFTDPKAAFKASAVNQVDQDERAVRSRVVGEGILNWPAILLALDSVGYQGVWSIEYEYRWHPQDLPPPAEGFVRSALAIRRMAEAVS